MRLFPQPARDRSVDRRHATPSTRHDAAGERNRTIESMSTAPSTSQAVCSLPTNRPDPYHATGVPEASPLPPAAASRQVADPSGESAHASVPRCVDILIIGAGPVGLFAAFQAGVLGLSCEIVEALDEPGGQCTELYPDKPIFDIPALPICTARELVSRLLEQARPFGAAIHLGQQARTLQAVPATPPVATSTAADPALTEIAGTHHIVVQTDRGLTFHAAAVLLCAGNGAFVPQRISGPAAQTAEALEGHAVHYAVRDIARFRGQRVVIAGGGDSALDWALALRDVASTLTLVHRRDTFRAADASVAALRAAVARGDIALRIGTIGNLHTAPAEPSETGNTSDTAQILSAITLKERDGDHTIASDQLLVLYGLVAALGPIADWGLDIAGGRTTVDPLHFQTSIPRVYAAGDIAGYGNKQKLILSGFHEAALALRHAYRHARPEKTRTHIHSSYDARLAAIIQQKDAPATGMSTR
ncbi:NAD(P)/FAD-dependent oxidoreductase [Robbsia andropogonis]|uniref:NAD(P)/FAD-dependent oxidoreductase n=1 Tax=Robbsia andropogonis TaxID=28092 RepID=UPI003D1BE480